ncbi:MAG: hypothetical protein AB1489_26785 [Acidobacteriota bacterium]
MRDLEEAKALVQLRRSKQRFAQYIQDNYAYKAVDCRTCTTICCIDDHFVNINITRLEARAIWQTLSNSPRISAEKFNEIIKRARQLVEKYRLTTQGETFRQTYSCPLYESGIGCLVHWKAKPAPCIQHGCYENWQDLPDTAEFARVERRIEQINEQVYRNKQETDYATIPVWLSRLADEVETATLDATNDDDID